MTQANARLIPLATTKAGASLDYLRLDLRRFMVNHKPYSPLLSVSFLASKFDAGDQADGLWLDG